jgi:hypothetical protein
VRGKAHAEWACGYATDDCVRVYVMTDDRAGSNDGAGSNAHPATGLPVTKPHVVPDDDARCTPPVEEFLVILVAQIIHTPSACQVVLRHPVHRVIARIDPTVRCDRAVFCDLTQTLADMEA